MHQVQGQLKHADSLDSQIYVIYESPATMLDVFSLAGRYIASFDVATMIKNVSPAITLMKLNFVMVPLLKWNGRRNKLLTSFGA